MIGAAVISRANANTASTCAQLTSWLETPTSRSASSRMTYSAMWLTIVVSVSATQRRATRSMVSFRNRTARSPHR